MEDVLAAVTRLEPGLFDDEGPTWMLRRPFVVERQDKYVVDKVCQSEIMSFFRATNQKYAHTQLS
jgi:hypothetical protein